MTEQTVAGTVEKRAVSGAELVVKQYQARLATVLPQHIKGDQFVGLALAALYRDPKLLLAANNNVGAFMNALMRCASLGHQPGTEEFYLIPRRNKKNKGLQEVQGIEGYRGIIERMYRSGAVSSVVVREVCAKDRFRYIEGITEIPQHNWSGADTDDTDATGADFFGANGSRDRGQMVGVYAYAKLVTGAYSRVVLLTYDDVMAARAMSDGADSEFSPWNRLDSGPARPEFRGRSMWWKTAARRLEPWVPTSAEFRLRLAEAAAKAEQVTREEGFRSPFADTVDGEVLPDEEPQNTAADDTGGAAWDDVEVVTPPR